MAGAARWVDAGASRAARKAQAAAQAEARVMSGKKGGARVAPPGGGKGKRGRPIPKAPNPLTPTPITADEVERAYKIATSVLPPPGQAARLASIFTAYKAQFLEAAEHRRINALAAEAGEAVRSLSRTLPALHQHHARLAERGDPFSGWQADACRDLLAAIARADLGRIEGQSNVPAVVRDWRWFADVIRAVVAPAFPTIRGTAKNGPVSRFLAAIIPLVSGEAPTAVAVATHLMQRQTGR